ncbi:UDP-glycosyltransferase 73C3-like protein [Drosera capensis]
MTTTASDAGGCGGEILVLPFFGQGHLFPCIELTKHLSSRNFTVTLIVSSSLSSSLPSSLTTHIHLIPSDPIGPSPPGPGPNPVGPEPFGKQQDQMGAGIEEMLKSRPDGSTRPVCAVVDVMMSWSKEVFRKHEIPVVAFFTSGACSAAMEYGGWKERVGELRPGETRAVVPRLGDEMGITYEEIQRRARSGPGGPPGWDLGGRGGRGGRRMRPFGAGFRGPPGPGQRPMWVDEVEGAAGILMNTCHELEGPFLDYVAEQIGKPVWGVGPLLPDEFWSSAGSVLHDRKIRPRKESSHTEDEVGRWLDSKSRGSVLYVSFGSEVGPTRDEYGELERALEESVRPFIWVIQLNSGRPGPSGGGGPSGSELEDGYFPHGLANKVQERGLIIHGWAPQLLILSHPSTGGFLSHCGWNSTVEGIGRGIPFLAWPIRGDQFYNAKLVVSHLKIGYMVLDNKELSEMVKSDDIAEGIERLMGDEGIKGRAVELKVKFETGFPASSEAALDAFRDFLEIPSKKTRLA